MSSPDAGTWLRVVLVGFMGAGKTAVAEALATRLGWRSVDVDEVIERESGITVAEIFEAEGESGFRARESAVTRRLLDEEYVVLSVGGGWGAVPGRLDTVPEGTATVWLDVSPEEAVRRAASQPGTRPLLEVADPVERARSLMEERASGYRGARWRVDTERSSVEDVTARIQDLLSASPPETRTE